MSTNTNIKEIIYIKSTKNFISIMFLVLVLVLVFALSVLLGPSKISPFEIIRIITFDIFTNKSEFILSTAAYAIIINLRIPRSLLAIITGIVLSSSGSTYQAIFKNPLADPYLLGVGTGAGLGAVIGLTIYPSNLPFANFGAALFAFGGGLLAVFLTYNLSNYSKNLNHLSLILAGVAITSIMGAFTTLILITQNPEIKPILSWLLGGFSLASWEHFNIVFLSGIPCVALLYSQHNKINILNLDSKQVHSLGINEKKTITILIIASTLSSSIAVSQTGIIGFVGLVAPHISRMAWGTNPKYLIPQASLVGAIILLSSDILAKTILSPTEIPVGLITAFLGFPFFVQLLRKEGDIHG